MWARSKATLFECIGGKFRHHPVYRDAAAAILRARNIPSLGQINDWLRPTGWRAEYVDGYVDVQTYQKRQAQHIFPVARSLRGMHEFEHSAAPDLVHDVLGHLPMLFIPEYRDLVQKWAVTGLKARPTDADDRVHDALQRIITLSADETANERAILTARDVLKRAHVEASRNPSVFFQLQMFYTWVIEYGVIRESTDSYFVIGAAALSSSGEMKRICSGLAVPEPLTCATFATGVDYTIYQRNLYYVSDIGDYQVFLDTLAL